MKPKFKPNNVTKLKKRFCRDPLHSGENDHEISYQRIKLCSQLPGFLIYSTYLMEPLAIITHRRLHLKVQTNPRLEWQSQWVNKILCNLSLVWDFGKSPRKEVMPMNRKDAAISDQGRCVFYRVFCGGCYQRSGGAVMGAEWEEASLTKPNKQRK